MIQIPENISFWTPNLGAFGMGYFDLYSGVLTIGDIEYAISLIPDWQSPDLKLYSNNSNRCNNIVGKGTEKCNRSLNIETEFRKILDPRTRVYVEVPNYQTT